MNPMLMNNVLAAVLFAATDYAVASGLRRIRTSVFGVFNRIVDGDVNAEIVISGSSRALNNFDPRIVQAATGLTTFNIGVNGSQTDMQVAVVRTYLQHNVKPALLIHSLDSFAFVTSHGGVFFPGQYLPYLREAPIYQALQRIDGDTWKSRFLPLYGYAVEDMNFTWITGLRARLGWSPREDRYFGFQPRDERWTGEFGELRDSHPQGVRFDIEPEGVRQLEDLLAFCQAQGIRVLLVYSPVYYEMQALETNRQEIFARFQHLSERYGATLWDFSRSPVSYRKELFVNSEHLNAGGAAAFSNELASALAHSPLTRDLRQTVTRR